MLRIGSLFSGYGGLDLAVLNVFPESRVVWHCEWEDAPSRKQRRSEEHTLNSSH